MSEEQPPLSADDPLLSPKLKIERAKTHIKDIHRIYRIYRESKPYGGAGEIDPNTNQMVYKFRLLKPIPYELATVTGDAVQNLRAALDHVACCLAVQRNENVNINDVAFPIGSDIESFESIAEKKNTKTLPRS